LRSNLHSFKLAVEKRNCEPARSGCRVPLLMSIC
jgi:hypothetical protein